MGRIGVRVQPGASRRRVVGKVGEEWKVAVTAPPAEGKANQACIELLAEVCGAPKSAVTLVAGAASRRKIFDVEGLVSEAIEDRIRAACASLR